MDVVMPREFIIKHDTKQFELRCPFYLLAIECEWGKFALLSESHKNLLRLFGVELHHVGRTPVSNLIGCLLKMTAFTSADACFPKCGVIHVFCRFTRCLEVVDMQ